MLFIAVYYCVAFVAEINKNVAHIPSGIVDNTKYINDSSISFLSLWIVPYCKIQSAWFIYYSNIALFSPLIVPLILYFSKFASAFSTFETEVGNCDGKLLHLYHYDIWSHPRASLRDDLITCSIREFDQRIASNSLTNGNFSSSETCNEISFPFAAHS